jgi:hypothetical protein
VPGTLEGRGLCHWPQVDPPQHACWHSQLHKQQLGCTLMSPRACKPAYLWEKPPPWTSESAPCQTAGLIPMQYDALYSSLDTLSLCTLLLLLQGHHSQPHTHRLHPALTLQQAAGRGALKQQQQLLCAGLHLPAAGATVAITRNDSTAPAARLSATATGRHGACGAPHTSIRTADHQQQQQQLPFNRHGLYLCHSGGHNTLEWRGCQQPPITPVEG